MKRLVLLLGLALLLGGAGRTNLTEPATQPAGGNGPGLGKERTAVKAFRFVHMSDTHFGAGNNQQADLKLFEEISKLEPQPAFCVNTGDVAEIGNDEEYQQLRDALKSLRPKMYIAPGNHDVRWNPRGKDGYVAGTGQPLYQSWDFNGIHFVTLDSTVLLQHWGHISREQLDWLKKDLDALAPGTPVVIGFHHWIGRDKVMVDNEQRLMDLVEPYNVVLWLQGHGHSDIQWSINGVPAVMQKGLYQGSYMVIDVEPQQMKLKRRALVDPKRRRSNELVRDKSVPATEEVEWVDVMRVELEKQPRPTILINEHKATAFDAQVEPAVEGTVVEGSVDGAAYAPMSRAGNRWRCTDPDDLMPGEHEVRVRVTLPDGPVYFAPRRWTSSDRAVWETNVGGAVQSRLLCADGTLFVPSMGGDLVALDAKSGNERWRVKTGGPVFSTPHIDGGTVYFGSDDHHVYAADANTGSVKWKTKTGGAVLGSASTARGVVCIGSVDTYIYGLDQATGDVRWKVKALNMCQSKAASDGERFFVGSWDNHFRCIDAKSGDLVWDLKLGKSARADWFSAFSPAITSPAVGDGKVFVSTNDGILHALDTNSGKELWRVDWQKMGYSSPLYRDGRVYCALSDEGKTFCVDANTGKFIWTAETGSVIYDSSFAFGGGNVYIGCVEGIFNAIRAEDGKMMWQYRLGPGHVLASPATDERHVFIASMSGKVTALPHAAKGK